MPIATDVMRVICQRPLSTTHTLNYIASGQHTVSHTRGTGCCIRRDACFYNMDYISTFTRRFEFNHTPTDAVFKLSHISHSTRRHLKNVYASLILCTLVATAGSCVYIGATYVPMLLIGLTIPVIIGSLISVIWLGVTIHNPETEKTRLFVLLGLASLTGFSIGPVLHPDISVDEILLLVIGTGVLFTCCTLSALCLERRIYVLAGGVGPIIIILLLLTTIDIVYDMNTYLGVLVYCTCITIDTQLIIERAENGDKDYIWHCVGLFLDVARMFQRIAAIVSNNKSIERRTRGHDEL